MGWGWGGVGAVGESGGRAGGLGARGAGSQGAEEPGDWDLGGWAGGLGARGGMLGVGGPAGGLGARGPGAGGLGVGGLAQGTGSGGQELGVVGSQGVRSQKQQTVGTHNSTHEQILHWLEAHFRTSQDFPETLGLNFEGRPWEGTRNFVSSPFPGKNGFRLGAQKPLRG